MIEFYDSSCSLYRKSMSELDIVNIGHEQCAPGYGYGPIIRPYFVIHFVKSGCGRMEVNEKTYHIHAGEAFVIPMHELIYYEADREDPWEYAWIGFIGTRGEGYLKRFMDTSPDRYVLHDLNVLHYTELLESGAALSGVSAAHSFSARALLYEIFARLFEDLEIEQLHDEHTGLAEETRFFIDTNYMNHLKIADIAERFHVHPNYLTRCYREKYHTTPKQYLMNLIVLRATELLEHTDMPVSLIATAVGIDDQLAFSKFFRKRVGLSPSEYRQKNIFQRQ